MRAQDRRALVASRPDSSGSARAPAERGDLRLPAAPASRRSPRQRGSCCRGCSRRAAAAGSRSRSLRRGHPCHCGPRGTTRYIGRANVAKRLRRSTARRGARSIATEARGTARRGALTVTPRSAPSTRGPTTSCARGRCSRRLRRRRTVAGAARPARRHAIGARREHSWRRRWHASSRAGTRRARRPRTLRRRREERSASWSTPPPPRRRGCRAVGGQSSTRPRRRSLGGHACARVREPSWAAGLLRWSASSTSSIRVCACSRRCRTSSTRRRWSRKEEEQWVQLLATGARCRASCALRRRHGERVRHTCCGVEGRLRWEQSSGA